MALILTALAIWVWPARPAQVGLRRPSRLMPAAPIWLSTLWSQAITVMILGVAAGGLLSPASGVAVVIIGGTCRLLLMAAHRERVLDRTRSETADLVNAVARDLATGSSLANALATAGRSAGRFAAPLVADLAASTHLSAPDARSPAGGPPGAKVLPAKRALLAACALSRRHGLPLAALIAGVGDGLALEVVSGLEKGAGVAGAKFSGYLLAALPLLGVGLGMAMNANPLPVLLGTGLGSVLLLTGVMLTCGGLLWSARIAR